MVKIDFEIVHPTYGVYRDALYLPKDHNMSDEQIKAIQQGRFDNWVNIIENPPVEELVEENQEVAE